ncbi:MAG: hypothetical protein IKL85_07425 [Lentisphaeria bacterium]|nr:hypothetical protein [Lentisphaeria bacterium]
MDENKDTGQHGMGEMRVLKRENDLFYLVEIAVMRDGLNRNGWDYRNVEKYADTFKGCPILTAYVGNKIGDGHNMDQKMGPDGEMYYSTMSPYAERIVGCIGENEGDIRVEERDGQRWIIARGRLWRFYHRELVDKIASQGRMAVSAETEVFEGENEWNAEVYTNWRGLGVTILGDDVQPAIPGANVKALSELMGTLKEMKLKAASLERDTDEPEEDDKPDESETPESEDEPDGQDDDTEVHDNADAKRGVRKKMSKKQLAEMAKRFGEGCRVLAADDKHVCMLRNGEPSVYVFDSKDETIVPEHYTVPEVTACFRFDGENSMEVDIADLTSELAANSAEFERLYNAEKERADKAEETVRKMQEVEKARRIQDVKNALKARLNEIMAEMEVDGCEELCDNLCGQAEEYVGDCGNAEWNGAEMAADELNARCMKRVLEAARRKNESEKKTLAWDLNVKNGGADDGLTGAIERILR